MKKIFCFDIDHTLLDYRSFTIPEEAIEAIKELKQQGHIITLASGRNLEHGDSNIYVDMVEPHAGIHCNGQKVTVGNKILFERRFNPRLLKDILEYSKQNNICIGIGVDGEEYYTFPDQLYKREMEVFGHCDKTFQDVFGLIDKHVYSLAVFGDETTFLELTEAFPELTIIPFSGGGGADVMDCGITKADGIKYLLEYYKLTWEDVIAFGDNSNDITMIENAGVGIAMGNATEVLKQKADFITKATWENGIVYALTQLKYI